MSAKQAPPPSGRNAVRRGAVAAALLGIALLTGAATAGAATPHMDRVEAAMRKVAPDLEGVVYRRTENNRFVGYNGRARSWLLQTPDCWGQRACGNPAGIRRFLRTLTADLARARTLVDLTTLIPYPFGGFQQAIERGLRRAYERGRRPLVRVLGGCAPPCGFTAATSPAQPYADQLAAAIGGRPRVVVASYRYPPVGTPADAFSLSWNHAKTISIDGRVALVGGHNLWGADYIQGYPRRPVVNPVHDVTIRAEGPVTAGVHSYVNGLWRAACAAARTTAAGAANGATVAYAAGTARACPARVRPPRSPRPGGVDVLGFGQLGLRGVRLPSSPGPPDPSSPSNPGPCPSPLPFYTPGRVSPDWTNNPAYTPAFDRRNPAGAAFRTLIRSARSAVFISQQDLHGICNPGQAALTPNFDQRLLDAIANRLLAGVDVRVVISTPGAAVSAQETYSNSTSLAQTSDAVLARTRVLAGSAPRARRAFRRHFRLRAIRFSASRVWPNAPPQLNKIAQHNKLGMVDNCAIWVGSDNLYPFWLSEYSLLVENRRIARTFKRDFADRLWIHSAGGRPLPGRPCARR